MFCYLYLKSPFRRAFFVVIYLSFLIHKYNVRIGDFFKMNNEINYKRIFILLGFVIPIVTISLYVALKANKVEEYPFIGDWSCKQKDAVVTMHLQITDSSIFENGKKLPDYYPQASKVKENTYNLYHGNERFAKIKEINEKKISFKKNVKNAKSYYCKRNVITK